MKGTVTLLKYLSENWINIVLIISLIAGFFSTIKEKLKLSKDEKIELILQILKKEILSFMADSEISWSDFEKFGAVKKAEVIEKIYEKYPELQKYYDQNKLLENISTIIEQAMGDLRKVFNR